MNRLRILIRRNIKLYLRDKAAVFFSFLSTIIVVALYFLFIANIYVQGMNNPEAGGITMALSNNAKNFVIYWQMIAGVLVLNSISLATGVFSSIAKDFESRRIDGLMLTPAKTYEIILSYLIAGFLVSFFINVLTLILSMLVIGPSTGYWLAIESLLMAVVVLLIATFISCCLMFLVTAIIKSSTAIGVMNGVLGTLFGFLCGIYMPYGSLGNGAKAVGSFLPFSHLTIWLKQAVLDNAFLQLGIGGEAKHLLYADYFSAQSIGFCNLSAPLWLMIILSVSIGIVCLVASWLVLNKRIKR